MIREDNIQNIEEFNNNNKKKLKSLSSGSAQGVTGGNSYVAGVNKFVEFTEEEFVKYFTGLDRPEVYHAHQHHKAEPTEAHTEVSKSRSH